MKEYWEITHERATATVAVWNLQSTFALKGLTLAQHTTNCTGLPTQAAARALVELATNAVRADRDDALRLIREANARVPNLLEGHLDDNDDLHEELDLVFAVSITVGVNATLRRARLLAGVWGKYNVLNLATPLTIKWKPDPNGPEATISQSDFVTALNGMEALLTAVANAERDVASAKSVLRTLERKVDRGNKRFYKAWVETYPEGTTEGDAARSTIPTEAGVPLAQILEIANVTPQAGGMLLVAFDTSTGQHATTRELLRQLPGDLDFGNTVAITGSSIVIGPFPPGTLVKLRTRVANSNPGVVWSATTQIVMP